VVRACVRACVCVRVCACVRARARACARACVYVSVRVYVRVRACVDAWRRTRDRRIFEENELHECNAATSSGRSFLPDDCTFDKQVSQG
jgi:hypothetical protein